MTVVLNFDPEDCDTSHSQSGWAGEVRDVEGDARYCSGCIKCWEGERIRSLRIVGVIGGAWMLTGECVGCGTEFRGQLLLVLASWPTLSEIVGYEVEMFAELAARLERGDRRDQVVINALVEAFAIHTRQLIDFLFAETMGWPVRVGDVTASSFHVTASAWREQPSDFLVKTRERVHKLVAHMTRTRAGVSAEEKKWMVPQIRNELVAALQIFARGASPVRFLSTVRDYVLALETS